MALGWSDGWLGALVAVFVVLIGRWMARQRRGEPGVEEAVDLKGVPDRASRPPSNGGTSPSHPSPTQPLPLDTPPPPSISKETLQLLVSFDVDPVRGFLPPNDPVQRLAHPELQEWERLIAALPELLANHGVRAAVAALPELPADLLKDEDDRRRALLLLSALASAYVWGEPTAPRDVIPANVARPLCAVAARVGVPPVLAHLSVVLYNWRRIDPAGPIATGNLAPLVQFLGDPDEAAFYYMTVDIEARGGPAIASLLEARRAAAAAADAVGAGGASHARLAAACVDAADALTHCAACVRAMRATLLRLPERCDPHVFYHRVRPFLSGWRGNPTLPDGVLYEGADDSRRRKYYGGSAAQSTLAPALDLALGVTHGKSAESSRSFLRDMREYMPPGHRRLLEHLEAPGRPTIRGFVSAIGGAGGIEAATLRTAYNDCLAAVEDFRTSHIGVVARYILLRQRQQAREQAATAAVLTAAATATATAAAATAASEDSSNVCPGSSDIDEGSGADAGAAAAAAAYALGRAAGGKGTGGTGLIEFLRPLRDDVRTAKLPESR